MRRDDRAIRCRCDQRRVKAEFGRIDVLVNSAGIGRHWTLRRSSPSTTGIITMAVNLRGAFLVSQQVGRVMLAQGSGTVISLASQAATVALPGHLAYCASKFGLVGHDQGACSGMGRTRSYSQHHQSRRW